MADKTTKQFTPISTEISKYGVVSLATRPNQPSSYGVGDLSATDLKKRFDYLANAIIKEYNDLIKLFNSDEILGYLKAHSGSLKSALEQITNTDGNLITKNPADQKGENEVLNERILKFYNAIVELQAFTEVKKDIHKDKTLSGVYETIANVKQFNAENAEAHKALTDLITTLQEFLGLNEHEGDSPLDGVIKVHISDHNDPESLAHGDIRQSVEEAQTNANKYAETVVSEHNVSVESHSDIRQDVINAETNAKGYADGILREHNNNAEAHKSIRDSVTAVAGDLSSHKTANDSHNDIRSLIKDLSDRINALHDTDDTTLDQTKEIVAYIKANRALIDSITTSKVNVDDIIKNLTTNVDNKPLAASQGVVLKGLIDTLTNEALNYAKKTDLNNYVQKSGNKVLSDNNYTTDEKNKLAGIDLSKYYTTTETYNKTEVDGLLANFEPPDDNSQIDVGELQEFEYTDAEGNTKRAKELVNGNIAFDEQYNDFVVANNIFVEGSTKPENRLIDMWYVDKKLPEKFATIESLGGYVKKESGKGLSTNDYTNTDKAKLNAIDEKHIELGNQVSAKGDYSAAFNKGIIGSEAVFETEYYGQTITVSLKDAFTKGVSVEAIDVVENTIDVYGTCKVSVWGTSISLDLAYAFSKISGERFNFVIEISAGDIKAYYPAIEVKEVKTNNKTCARLTIHKSCSVSGISTLDKVTNIYGGFAYEDGSMTVNSRNIAWGESSFSSGTGNVSIAPNSHTQNISNIASGDAGSASGSFTEAGATAFSTGHKTKALGESSLTFGIRSETKYTESTESIEKEGGKGSIAGGYQAKANARYSASFGVDTHSDREGQLVCGLANATDTNALFIVGAGNNRNAFTVDKNGKGTLLNLKVGNDAAVVTGGNGTLGVGNRTIAGGESSLTFGIGSQTALTTYGDGAVDGGKGAIAGGYEAKANARYSQAFGYSTHSDREGQLVCGYANATDANALFIVGQGSSTNALAVKTNGDGYFNGNIYTNGVKVATVNDIPVIPDIPENSCPISEGAGTGAAQMGDRTSANANYSLAGGETSTTATGAKACLAFGISAEARANGSASFGWRTVANCENELVAGRCNNYENWGQALFVVGNGTSDSDRRNALVVNGNGDTYITGKAFSGGLELATKQYVMENSSGGGLSANVIAILQNEFKHFIPSGEISESAKTTALSKTQLEIGGYYSVSTSITIPSHRQVLDYSATMVGTRGTVTNVYCSFSDHTFTVTGRDTASSDRVTVTVNYTYKITPP